MRSGKVRGEKEVHLRGRNEGKVGQPLE